MRIEAIIGIAISSVITYTFIGMIVGSLVERSDSADARALSDVAGVFWPLLGPAWILFRIGKAMLRASDLAAGAIHRRFTRPKINLPTATARQNETK